MVNISRVRVLLTGFIGGPGVSTFYTTDIVTMRNSLNGFYSDMSPLLPGVLNWSVDTSGDVIDPISGDLVGSWSSTTPHVGVGAITGSYPAPAGSCINWNTGDVLDGHRLRGRTFMVPLGGTQYDADGSLAAAGLAATRANATTMITNTAGSFVVWHRPRITPARAGGFSVVTSSTVNDKVAVLRSRRD